MSNNDPFGFLDDSLNPHGIKVEFGDPMGTILGPTHPLHIVTAKETHPDGSAMAYYAIIEERANGSMPMVAKIGLSDEPDAWVGILAPSWRSYASYEGGTHPIVTRSSSTEAFMEVVTEIAQLRMHYNEEHPEHDFSRN